MPGIAGVLPCGRRSWGGPGGPGGGPGPLPPFPGKAVGPARPCVYLTRPGGGVRLLQWSTSTPGGVEYVYSRTVPWWWYCSVRYRPLRAGKSKFGEREAGGLGPKRAAENLIKALDQSYQE